MAAESGANRWWEYYLVRYLMPSIAGVVIVSWLCTYAGNGLSILLFLPFGGKLLDTASLVLLFLYGNLFCYVASYPVLVFHVTRVRDFSDGKWPAKPFSDGYLVSFVLIVITFSLFHWDSPVCRYWLALLVALIFALIQFRRLFVMTLDRTDRRSFTRAVSLAFWYAYALARRRGDHKVSKTDVASQSPTQRPGPPKDPDEYDEVTTHHQIKWHSEFIATYRHLREHGNSAFIFVLELILAALVYCVITKPGQSPTQQLGATGFLFAIWASPSVLVHLLGQHLERRFSQFDERVTLAAAQAATSELPR